MERRAAALLITREVDYALRILRALTDGEQHTTGDLCQTEQVPQQFAYKILKKLGKAGMVTVARGAEGGCRLTADLEQTSLYDLMEAMEATELVNACMEPGYRCTWREHCGKTCLIHTRLEEVRDAVDRELRRHSLASLLTVPEESGL